MTRNKFYITVFFLLSCVPVFTVNAVGKLDAHSNEHQHDQSSKSSHDKDGLDNNHSEKHAEHEGEGLVALDLKKLNSADIVVGRIDKKLITTEISAPGEVIINAYLTSKVTPRISAQVIERHKRLGGKVKNGERLVTLSSVEMAQAQGELLVTSREWQRVKKLGAKVISDSRHSQAEVNYQQAFARVLAFGMTRHQVESLLNKNDVTQMTGTFELLAQQNGTIIRDDFIIGEIIEAGRVLFEITDEKTLWIEAQLSPVDAATITIGALADIQVGNNQIRGKVIQIHHSLDEKTRTFPIRIEVPNNNDLMHPGQFVETKIQSQQQTKELAVPQEAILRSPDGDWIVFVEVEAGQYRAIEIERVRTVNNEVVVTGLQPGVRIVTQGAFFVQSELAKSGFDVHNH